LEILSKIVTEILTNPHHNFDGKNCICQNCGGLRQNISLEFPPTFKKPANHSDFDRNFSVKIMQQYCIPSE